MNDCTGRGIRRELSLRWKKKKEVARAKARPAISTAKGGPVFGKGETTERLFGNF